MTSPTDPQGPLKPPINLLRGWPSPATLPAHLLSSAAVRTLADPSTSTPGLQYGDDPGYQPLREALSTWLSATYGPSRPTPSAENLCITAGASLGLANVLQSFTDPSFTQAVWIVAPCYFLACPIFEDAGFAGRLRAVPEGEEGIDLAVLRRGLEGFEREGEAEALYKVAAPDRKFYRHVIYAVPTCSNPSGQSMPLHTREELVHLARKHNALIVCDDVYDALQWPVAQDGPPPPPASPDGAPPYQTFPPVPLPQQAILPRLSDIDSRLGPSRFDTESGKHFGHAISNGSFSKLLGPGMRTGWVEGTPAFAHGLSQTGSTRSGGSPSQFAAMIVADLIQRGDLDVHLDTCVRPALQRRHALALAAVKTHLRPLGVEVIESSIPGGETFGGFFLWLTLPPGLPPASELAKYAGAEGGVIVGAGDMFEVAGDKAQMSLSNKVRLCFAWEDEGRVGEGIERFARCLERAVAGESLAVSSEMSLEHAK